MAGQRYITLADHGAAMDRMAVDGAAVAALSDDDCWPFNRDLGCFDVEEGARDLAGAVTTATNAGRLSSSCAATIGAYLARARAADDWSTLSGGEYHWLNASWHALVRNDGLPPIECLTGATSGTPYDPGTPWTPPPDDPQPPGGGPWIWIAGVGAVAAGVGLYLLLHKNKKTTRKKR